MDDHSKEKQITSPAPSSTTTRVNTPVPQPAPVEPLPIQYQYLDFDTVLPHALHELSSHPTVPKIHHLTHPFTWSAARKSILLTLACLSALSPSFATSSYGPGARSMGHDWGVSRVVATTGLTAFTTGFALGPLLLAPLAEIVGRKVVFLLAGVIYVGCSLGCGLTEIYAGMVVARLFAGLTGSAYAAMVTGLIADLYPAAERKVPIALFSAASLFGVGLGPIVAGFLVQYASWRWIFHVQTIFNAVLVMIVAITVKESRTHLILHKKAKALNRWYEIREQAGLFDHCEAIASEAEKSLRRVRWRVKEMEEREDLGKMVAVSLSRPFQILFTEPVAFVLCLWVALGWSVLYILLSVVPVIFQRKYDFSLSEAECVFVTYCIDGLLAAALDLYQEPLAKRFGLLPSSPEARLYFCCVEGMLLPVGLLIFGWSCQYDVPWIVPAIGVGVTMLGVYLIFLSVSNYLVDMYGPSAGSAVAALNFSRHSMSGASALVAQQMYARLGFGGASTLLAGVAFVLGLAPWVLIVFGEQIRMRSRFANPAKK